MLSFLRLKHQREFEIELYNISEGVCSDKELREIAIRELQEKIEQKQREIDELKRDKEGEARTANIKIDSLLAELQQREFVIDDYKNRINEIAEKLERVAEGKEGIIEAELGFGGFYGRMERI